MPASGSKQAARAQPKGSLRLLCARVTKNKYLTVQKKGRTSDECEVQRCIKLSNGISIDVYALPMIVALSFRLNALGAYKVREYVMNKLTTKPRNGILFLNVRTHECMSENKYGHN